jgi:hypothetical protein
MNKSKSETCLISVETKNFVLLGVGLQGIWALGHDIKATANASMIFPVPLVRIHKCLLYIVSTLNATGWVCYGSVLL